MLNGACHYGEHMGYFKMKFLFTQDANQMKSEANWFCEYVVTITSKTELSSVWILKKNDHHVIILIVPQEKVGRHKMLIL